MALLRGFWLGVEDPRALALFRIVFGVLAVCNVEGLREHFVFLFGDDGIFSAAAARQLFAAEQLAGFRDGQDGGAAGFVDERALGHFLAGPRLSLLWFWGSPTAVAIHVAAFELCMLAFVLGLRTRTAGVLGFLLMCSLFDRNPLFWEATELVFRVFFVYLLCARCGHAWSIDNWLRVRKLGHRAAPLYRPIPAWPRRLMMLQLALLYLASGMAQHGEVWRAGDAIHYAISLDHFQRFETQPLCTLLGTNVLRVLTHIVRFGELGFVLVFVGELVRVALEQRRAPPTRTRAALGWLRRWVLGRRVWIVWSTLTMAAIGVVMNLGVLQPVMLALGLVYFRGEEVARTLAWLRGQRRAIVEEPPSRAWAYDPFGQICLGVVLTGHIAALAVWTLPAYDAIAGVREPARALVRPWLALTRTDHGWGFFAPNPVRKNVFMKVVVIEADGARWDLRTDLYAQERRPLPYLRYDRMRKIARRIIGGEAGKTEWYRGWYARWQCRQWAHAHEGVLPEAVELVRVSYEVPSPEQLRDGGPHDPVEQLRAHGSASVVHVERCADPAPGPHR